MKLSHDCIRDLLLCIEEEIDYHYNIDVESLTLKDYNQETIVYTADKLLEAGFINATRHVYSGHNGLPTINITSITWEGHKFLDNIRDDGVWKNTKSVLSKFASVSVGFIGNIASQVITTMINQELGLP